MFNAGFGGFMRNRPQQPRWGSPSPEFWGGFKQRMMERRMARQQPIVNPPSMGGGDMQYIQPVHNPIDDRLNMGGGSPPFYVPDRPQMPTLPQQAPIQQPPSDLAMLAQATTMGRTPQMQPPQGGMDWARQAVAGNQPIGGGLPSMGYGYSGMKNTPSSGVSSNPFITNR